MIKSSQIGSSGMHSLGYSEIMEIFSCSCRVAFRFFVEFRNSVVLEFSFLMKYEAKTDRVNVSCILTIIQQFSLDYAIYIRA